ncbi:MAG TPA: hypothetical protein VHO68_07965, partial [Bacteroidales bacterium]|nr:hypothetical protein [Bacteroidales bacterium]
EWREFRRNAYVLYEQPVFRNFIQHTLNIINSDEQLIKELLDLQNYRLIKWTNSSIVLNYRRFFTVNSLISLRMEDDEVFNHYHRLIAEEVSSNRIDGLRIDHIDGLKKPLKYVENLRLLTGGDKYIVAEKILGSRELLPFDIPLQGTSGYDFLGIVNSLLTYKKNYADLGNFYRKITGAKGDLKDLVYRKKKFILTKKMGGEWENLVRLLEESNLVAYDNYITRESMKNAIGEFLVLFPVYKFYSDSFPLTREESRSISSVLSRAVEKEPALEQSLIVLGNLFLYQEGLNDRQKARALDFYLRCMQFTGPLMAKGVEDTVMYNYNLLIGHNEVGDDPGSEGITVEEYHRLMQERQKNWPMTMNATSTHDTKRGEDVRARLNILTEMSEEWKKNVRRWKEVNSEFRVESGGKGCS